MQVCAQPKIKVNYDFIRRKNLKSLKINSDYYYFEVFFFFFYDFILFLESFGYLTGLSPINRLLLVMKKLAKRSFKGIEYILLSSLSKEQATSIRKQLTSRTLVKIMMYDKVVSDCVLYQAYEEWYATYQPEHQSEPATPLEKSVSLSQG